MAGGVLHIVSDLDAGGAETMLARLVERLGPDFWQPGVVSLTDLGDLGPGLAARGVPVFAMGMRRGFLPGPRAMVRLARLVRARRPDVVHTWMYHADLLGGLAARLFSRARVVWGIHHADLDPATTRPSTIRTARLCARLSGRVPHAIVCCSRASLDVHRAIGYRADRMRVIPNGFDLAVFHPDAAARAAVREELGIGPEAPLLGLAARFHPTKDHPTFLAAARRIAQSHPDAQFLLCGQGADPANESLRRWVAEAGLEARCHLLGRRDDMPRVFAALDLAVSASRREAFPLALGEAMAAGVPCVATDAGDSAWIVGETGHIVPVGDGEALAAACCDLLDAGPAERRRLGALARERIAAHFSLDAVAAQYAALYGELAGR